MAAPDYTTDLTTLHACDAASASQTEPTGFTIGTITLPETDFFIHNTGCLSKNQNSTGGNGAIYNTGAGQTIPTDGAFFAWFIFSAPNALAAQASGGIQMFIGSATSAFRQYYVRGSDTYAYGGWTCVPVNPTVTPDTSTGTPTTTYQYFGVGVNCPSFAPTKGQAFGLDVIRIGRGEARFKQGDSTNGYCTFSGFAAQNDALTNRWGLIQSIAGGYQWQGLMNFGYGAAVDFRDSNTMIVVANTQKVTSGFNKIEIRNASSRVDQNTITFLALGTVSRGTLVVVDDADVNITGCSFTQMGDFTFQSNSTIIDTIFSYCGQVTQGGAVFTGCTFSKCRTSIALLVDDVDDVDLCSFVSSGTGHAIQGFSTAGEYNIDTLSFTGYAASDGTTGNEAIYVTATSGEVTLYVTGSPSVRSAGATVTKVSSPVNFQLTGVQLESEIGIYKLSDGSELYHLESNTSSTVTYSYSWTSDIVAYVVIHNLGYLTQQIDVTLTSENQSIPIQQVIDRNYQKGSDSTAVTDFPHELGISGADIRSYASGGPEKTGFVFKPDSKGQLYIVRIQAAKYGSPTGSVYAKLYNMSGTFGTTGIPAGSALVTSEAINVSSAPAQPPTDWLDFTFTASNTYQLPNNSPFAISIESPDIASWNADNNLYYIAGEKTSNPDGGNGCVQYTDWQQADDLPVFEVVTKYYYE